ncbi:MAG: NAD(P)H-dependent oxidoreductase subunit E [Saprospiraceae bacterium]|nr:NAD(P)H-dependent oxidoreductase subunit E [Saprospiraceae bacterium]
MDTTLTSKYQISEALINEYNVLSKRFPEGKHKSTLLRMLHLVQEENNGWLSVPAMDAIADLLKINQIEVYEVATFYTMYNLEPVGKFVLEFCHTGPCAAVGVEQIIAYTKRKLGIETGQTTSDNMFTIKEVECLGACGYGPMMQVGQYFHERLTEEKIDQFIEDCRLGKIDKGTWKLK